MQDTADILGGVLMANDTGLELRFGNVVGMRWTRPVPRTVLADMRAVIDGDGVASWKKRRGID